MILLYSENLFYLSTGFKGIGSAPITSVYHFFNSSGDILGVVKSFSYIFLAFSKIIFLFIQKSLFFFIVGVKSLAQMFNFN